MKAGGAKSACGPGAATLLALLALAASTSASAQALERHLAPGASPPPDQSLAPPAPGVVDDDRLLAPHLTGLVLIGAGGDAAAWPRTAAIEDQGADVLDFPALERDLRPYLGRPLSWRLISRLQAAVTRHYRALNRPFVAIAPPPQEVSQGVLRLRVIEFHRGAETVNAKGAADRAAIARDVRVQAGQPIDARLLSEDLDWLDRSPFRQVQAQFSPGDETGATNLALTEAPMRPWRVFADYSNDGAPSSGFARLAVGAEAALPFVSGGFASYQLTGSPDAFANDGHVLPFGDARYLSHAFTATAPLAPRQALTLSLDYLTSLTPARSAAQDFALRQVTTEGALTYRFALSNLIPALAGDVLIGTELRRQQRGTLFGGLVVAKTSFDIAQAVLGYSLARTDGPVRQSWSVNLHYSPGGILGQNDDAALAQYSNGRVSHSRYLYLDAHYAITAPLGRGLTYQSRLDGQLSDHPLSDTESLALGGSGAVRGYTYDDGGFDQGVVWRNSLYLPAVQTVAAARTASAAPFLFADLGDGGDLGRGPHADAASAGLGAEGQWGAGLSGGLTAAVALNEAGETHAGTVRLLVHVDAQF